MIQRIPEVYEDVYACADRLIERLSGRIALALPLGLGKPVRLTNALYRRARENPDIDLRIYTALSLEAPRGSTELEARFLGPLAQRLYAGVPELDYVGDLRRNAVPENVHIEEYYFRPGSFLGIPQAQQNYTSINYTHAARSLLPRGINLVAHMVAPSEDGSTVSLSCNPEVTLDFIDAVANDGAPMPLLVAESNPRLPFMHHEAVLPTARFDFILDCAQTDYPLFPVPNRAVSLRDHAIALHIAGLIKDGGTLQIGIGILGDAISWALMLRRNQNSAFRKLHAALRADSVPAELDELPIGLYGMSEMFGEGFLHLRECGVLRRTVDDGIFLHAGFYLGSSNFYEKLRALSAAERRGIDMTRISFTNGLLGGEVNKRVQRQHARFVNSAMMVTLTGAAVSDGLENGQVVSGVGGQYNFVAMAHELEGARFVLSVPATRGRGARTRSNIVWNYGHVTIPRHLRDLVVTEYGVADLRGATDSQVIAALLDITDSRFQETLRLQAVGAGKLPAHHRIPESRRRNHPDALEARLKASGELDRLPFYPLGTDLTNVEAELAIALGALKEIATDRRAALRTALRGFTARSNERLELALERMSLANPRGLKERFYRALLVAALDDHVHTSTRPLFGSPGASVAKATARNDLSA